MTIFLGIFYSLILDQSIYWGANSFGVHWPLVAAASLGVVCGVFGTAISYVTTS